MTSADNNAVGPADAEHRYMSALRDFPLPEGEDLEEESREVWARAHRAWSSKYRGVRSFAGVAGPLDAEKLILGWQKELRREIREVCGRLEKPTLLLALRLVHPGGDPWGQNQYRAMGVRRIASHATLLFGREPSEDYAAPYGGVYSSEEKERFAMTFRKLIFFATKYLRAYGYRPLIAAGMPVTVAPEGPHIPDGEISRKLRETLYSSDTRSHTYYSPFTRIGEFSADAQPTRKVDEVALISTRYRRLPSGWVYDSVYDSVAWRLEPFREFLAGLDRDLCVRAWGMTGEEFFCLLAGLCNLILDKMTETSATNEGWRRSSVVPLKRKTVEGSELLVLAEKYLRKMRLSSGDFDLPAAQRKFLWLACSFGKEEVAERPLKIQLGDTRFSYLLHRFGRFYVADLFHSDHWLHRPFELLANQMIDEESGKKGRRFEDRLWKYVASLGVLRPIPELRRQKIYRTGRDAGDPQDDLDFTFALGNVLVLADAKAELLRYPTETMYRNAVQTRWKDTREYLEKIKETAQLLAVQRNRSNFSKGMAGIEYILPLVCRPYPEWVLSLDDTYWLRKPHQEAEDPGVPRVLTPGELRVFFEGMTESELIKVAGDHMVHVAGRAPQPRSSPRTQQD